MPNPPSSGRMPDFDQVPEPPAVGTKCRHISGTVYHVRAIVDYTPGPPDKRQYVVVLRYWRRKAWSYTTETCWSFMGLYTPCVKKKP